MDNEIRIENLPYTVISGTSTPVPRKRFCFTGEGIKAIAEQISNEDTVVYTSWADYSNECKMVRYYSKWTVIKHDEQTVRKDGT